MGVGLSAGYGMTITFRAKTRAGGIDAELELVGFLLALFAAGLHLCRQFGALAGTVHLTAEGILVLALLIAARVGHAFACLKAHSSAVSSKRHNNPPVGLNHVTGPASGMLRLLPVRCSS